MAKFWRVMGIILIGLDVIAAAILLFNGGGLLAALISGFFGGLIGALMITVGGLIERIESLEYDMSAAKSGGAPVTFLQAGRPPLTVVPRRTCARCEREYDADYSSCPYCGNRE